MKRKLILALVAGLIPVSLMAQDDLYFVPKKSTQKIKSSYEAIGGSDTSTTIYVGSNRNVDEYNRKGLSKYFQKIGTDSLGNDIVAFISDSLVTDTLHVYPGTEVKYDMEDDYTYSRRMSRFDDYYWYDPWFYSYGYGSGPYWSPWNYRWGWYDPWYYSWYDPWYYDWHYGWHSSWYYPYYYNWGYPIYVGGGGHRPIYAHNNGITGTRNHGTVNRGGATNRPNNFNGYRGNGKDHSVANNRGSGNGSFGGRRPSSDGTRNGASYVNSSYTPSSSSNGSFGGSRNSSYTPSSSSSSYSSGSFGGSRSSGGSFGGGGGTRSGGGGGSHSSGGGGSFGGRR